MDEGGCFDRPASRGRFGLGRRHALGLGLMAGTSTLLPRAGWAGIPASRRIAFNVIRKDSNIGTHVVTFAPAGPDLEVQVAVDIAVKLAGITLYRYTLRAGESWKSGTLMRAWGETQDGGDRETMTAERRDGRLVVEGTKSGRYIAPERTICASHWNPAEVEAPMISLQNGELLDFDVARRGRTTIPGAAGPVEAEHFALTGPAILDLWYDRQKVWSKLRAVARDGSVIDYQAV